MSQKTKVRRKRNSLNDSEALNDFGDGLYDGISSSMEENAGPLYAGENRMQRVSSNCTNSPVSRSATSPGKLFTWAGMYDTECVFRVRFSSVQCRNLDARKLRGTSDPFVEFAWGSSEQFSTPILKGELNPMWKGWLHAFEFNSTVAALKEQCLKIAVYSNRKFASKSLIGTAEIDLFTIATGAVHHDHMLIGSDAGRIVFNCYMEQFSDWEINVDNISVALPAIRNELDRPEGHDFQEDASLPLQKYAVSYFCTMGTNETFHMTNKLKHVDPTKKITFQEDKELSEGAIARLKLLSRKATSHRHGPNNDDDDKDTGAPVGVNWNLENDQLPKITRFSTFDELMSGTMKLEIRCLTVGRGQMSINPENRFLQTLNAYEKERATAGQPIRFSDDIRNTFLFGQSWLSLEKLFEDAVQERLRSPNPILEYGDSNSITVTAPFEQSLALKGHQCGYVYGTFVFTKVPNVRQLRCGVISENGVSASSSVIVGVAKKRGGKKGVLLPEEVQRVLEKTNGLLELMAMRNKDEKDAKIRKATKILSVLQISHKASLLSWVYANEEVLDETKNILLRLWEFLLENIRVRDYTLRNIFYELLYYLMKRAELGDLPLLGFDAIASSAQGTEIRPKEKDLAFGLRLRAMLLETKSCVLQAVSIRGVLNNNFMFFVARTLSILCFRLPSFGVELYQLWGKTYLDNIDVLSAELHSNAVADLFRMDGLEAHLDWRRFHKAIYDRYGANCLKAQEEDAEEKYEVTPGACKTRLSRIPGEANTLNILLVDQWMWYVLDTLAVLNQKIGWSRLPGYGQILKVFFIELRFQQRTGPLSPALYKLSCTMLANTSLINPMTKFLLKRTNVHYVPGVISAIELLGVWMYMIRSWRVRLGSYRLQHLENNDRWNFHRDAQYSIPTGNDVSLLPASYDFRFLSSALRILLLSEHTQVVLTTLEFLYNCWDCFPERHADKLRYELLNVFFKLFLHWNTDVRHFFHTLIAFRALKPHAWTLQGSSFVHTPPQSRRHIDAAAADFRSALGPDDVLDEKRARSYSASNIFESIKILSENLASPRSAYNASPRSVNSSPRSQSFSSPRSSTTAASFAKAVEARAIEEKKERKSRSISEDFTRGTNATTKHIMDPLLQVRFHRRLESIYAATTEYIEQIRSTGIVENDSILQKNGVVAKASWKKKGILLKQGFLYKNTWKEKHFSLQNNRLGYADAENGPVKREVNIKGSKIVELPNQIDLTHGTRIVLQNCFSVDNGYQKLTLCAPTYDDLREWMDVLQQNNQAAPGDASSTVDWKVSEISSELDGIRGKHPPDGTIDENVMAYTIYAVKEWLAIRIAAIDAEKRCNLHEPCDLPVLLSKSSSYGEDAD